MKLKIHPTRMARTAGIILIVALLATARAAPEPANAQGGARPHPVIYTLPQAHTETREVVEETEPGPTTVMAIVTAYAPADNKSGICADSDPSVTSTGKSPGPDYCAADPARLPYGTKLDIPGYGEVEVQDTGGALRSDKDNIRIDVWMPTYEDAMEWGRQELEVVIL